MKKHWLIFLLAFILGCISIYPQIYYIKSLGENFKGIHREINNDELYYSARIHDVMDGHPTLGNPDLWEFKDKPSLAFFIPDILLGKAYELFDLTVQEGLLLSDFIFPILITLLIYGTFLVSTRSRFWATVGTIFIAFGVYLDFFNRPVSPQVTALPWLLQGILLFLWIQKPERRKLLLTLNAICFGLTFYFYTYHSTYFLAFFPIATVLFYLKKERQKAFDMFVICVGGILIGIGYFINILEAIKLPEYNETLARVGMITTHFPSGIKILAYSGLVLVGYAIFYWRKKIKFDTYTVLFITGLATSIIVVNQHVITGKNLEFAGHYIVPGTLWATYALVYLLSKLITKKWPMYALATLVCIFGTYGVTAFLKTMSKSNEYEKRSQQYGPLVDWLRIHTNTDDVIFSDEETSAIIPSYTANNVFFRKEANLHFVPDEEIYTRFVIDHYIDTVDEAYVKTYFNVLFGNQYYNAKVRAIQENKVRKLLGAKQVPVPDIPKEAVDRVLEVSKKVHTISFEKNLESYRLDYVALHKKDALNWKLDRLQTFTKIAEAGDFIIYKHTNINQN